MFFFSDKKVFVSLENKDYCCILISNVKQIGLLKLCKRMSNNGDLMFK